MSHRLLSRRQAVAALAGTAWLLACGHRRPDTPVAISYGRDECDWCRMTVDDPALAAEWITSGGPPMIFGEAGCLLAWLAAHPGTGGSAWLRTQDGDGWSKATQVTVVRGLVSTPMAFNLTAHVRAPSRAPGLELFTWSDLLAKGAPDARPS